MPRHFYLRNVKSTHFPLNPLFPENFPVVCVAYTEPEFSMEDGKKVMEVRFATATYNPADLNTNLKWSKAKARNKSAGRLNTDNQYLAIDVPIDTTRPEDRQFFSIKKAICQSMLRGKWRNLHPGAMSAVLAAGQWLDSLLIITTDPPKPWEGGAVEQADGHAEPVIEIPSVSPGEENSQTKVEVAPAPTEINVVVDAKDCDILDTIFASPHSPRAGVEDPTSSDPALEQPPVRRWSDLELDED